jgi:hypothetical protein
MCICICICGVNDTSAQTHKHDRQALLHTHTQTHTHTHTLEPDMYTERILSPYGSESTSPSTGMLSVDLSFLRKRRVATSGCVYVCVCEREREREVCRIQ